MTDLRYFSMVKLLSDDWIGSREHRVGWVDVIHAPWKRQIIERRIVSEASDIWAALLCRSVNTQQLFFTHFTFCTYSD